jgi:hypothetical protein
MVGGVYSDLLYCLIFAYIHKYDSKTHEYTLLQSNNPISLSIIDIFFINIVLLVYIGIDFQIYEFLKIYRSIFIFVKCYYPNSTNHINYNIKYDEDIDVAIYDIIEIFNSLYKITSKEFKELNFRFEYKPYQNNSNDDIKLYDLYYNINGEVGKQLQNHILQNHINILHIFFKKIKKYGLGEGNSSFANYLMYFQPIYDELYRISSDVKLLKYFDIKQYRMYYTKIQRMFDILKRLLRTRLTEDDNKDEILKILSKDQSSYFNANFKNNLENNSTL